MFGIFKSKEKKIMEKVEEHFVRCKRSADAIVALDIKHNKENIIRLAEIFNENNVSALKLIYDNNREFNLLKPVGHDDIEFKKEEYNALKQYVPQYYMSKKDFKKFQKVMEEAVMGVYGEYRGV